MRARPSARHVSACSAVRMDVTSVTTPKVKSRAVLGLDQRMWTAAHGVVPSACSIAHLRSALPSLSVALPVPQHRLRGGTVVGLLRSAPANAAHPGQLRLVIGQAVQGAQHRGIQRTRRVWRFMIQKAMPAMGKVRARAARAGTAVAQPGEGVFSEGHRRGVVRGGLPTRQYDAVRDTPGRGDLLSLAWYAAAMERRSCNGAPRDARVPRRCAKPRCRAAQPQCAVQPGQAVAAGTVLLLIESMKMEVPVEAPCHARGAVDHGGRGRRHARRRAGAAPAAAGRPGTAGHRRRQPPRPPPARGRTCCACMQRRALLAADAARPEAMARRPCHRPAQRARERGRPAGPRHLRRVRRLRGGRAAQPAQPGGPAAQHPGRRADHRHWAAWPAGRWRCWPTTTRCWPARRA